MRRRYSVAGACMVVVGTLLLVLKTHLLGMDSVRTNHLLQKSTRAAILDDTPTFTPENFEEKLKYDYCVRNLQKFIAEDKKGYFANLEQSESMRQNHLAYLKKDSVVLEVGGNQGHDTKAIVDMYGPKIITLEPIKELAKHLIEKFKDHKNVTVLSFGLGKTTEEVFVKVKGEGGDATSVFSSEAGNTSLIIVNTTEFLLSDGMKDFDFDLILINCEGCEYDVLESILSNGLITKFRNVQFAAHRLPLLRNVDARYCKIDTILTRTHIPTYRYRFIWEHWKRKDLF